MYSRLVDFESIMNEDEKLKQEKKRARQREMVKERNLRAAKYNQELQKSI
jgi:hypothetical protein